MGPRPRGRGMLIESPLSIRSASLQWGRAHAGAEWPAEGEAEPVGVAFNGAAPTRARNGEESGEDQGACGAFNGAAPTRARNVPCPITHKNNESILQWGRAHAGAEWCLSPSPWKRQVFKLQWGRAHAGAECTAPFHGIRSRHLLQWGRAHAGAECQVTRSRNVTGFPASMGPRPRGRGMNAWPMSPHCPTAGFNGAAPTRARNDNTHPRTGRDGSLLQWGRAHAGAEWGLFYSTLD